MRVGPNLSGVLVLMVGLVGCGGIPSKIVVYGQNQRTWNQKLGASVTRSACANTPSQCIAVVLALLKHQDTTSFNLNIRTDPANVAAYALQYSSLSLHEPRLQEIGLDDFFQQFLDWCSTRGISCVDLLQQVIDNTKARNANLKFGITIYVNEIPDLLRDPRLTPHLRNQIDTVHLYVAYREQGPNFQQYVQQVTAAFPNATIVAGAYAYDRISYAPCTPSGMPCTTKQEVSLFDETLQIQVGLLRQGEIRGIEFYPGYFGMEDRWPGWKNPKLCAPDRRQSCIDNTKAMHEAAIQALEGDR